MRNVNLTIEDLDITTEDFICDFIDRLGYAYTVQEVKIPRQKKEKTIEDIFGEIEYRYNNSQYCEKRFAQNANQAIILVSHYKKGYQLGKSKRNPTDDYRQPIGYYLALVRACGWKDLEEELLSKL